MKARVWGVVKNNLFRILMTALLIASLQGCFIYHDGHGGHGHDGGDRYHHR